MIHLENRGAFPAELFSFPDVDGQEHEVLVVAATFVQGAAEGVLVPAVEQEPVRVADVHFGDPALSSLRYEAETAVEKPKVDILINGTAHAPGGHPVERLVVEFEAGDVKKRIQVIGDRFKGMMGSSVPRPFVTMPIVYERAYGGTARDDGNPKSQKVWRRNPIGIGLPGAVPSPGVESEYPNLEGAPGSPQGEPAGFGPIGRGWTPRIEWAGTFDDAWLKAQWPLLPRDFDVRHYQAAPPDQQAASLRSGDAVRLTNLTPEGTWTFAMPPTDVPIFVLADSGIRDVRMRIDTMVIEPDDTRVRCTYRLKLTPERGRDRIREIVLGDVTPGVLRARHRRKPYVHPRDLGSIRRSEDAAS